MLAVGAGGGGLDIFTLIYPFSPLSPSLWETARYRLKYCLKGPLNPKQPTDQPTLCYSSQNILSISLRKNAVCVTISTFVSMAAGSPMKIGTNCESTWAYNGKSFTEMILIQSCIRYIVFAPADELVWVP